MAENTTQRKLTAILSMDVKGYSKLMGDDDESTVNTITAYRRIIADLIKHHQGRVVDTPGDNILAEFSGALNAVNSAIEIQQRLAIDNEKLPSNRRMDFRIGINLGDVLHKDQRIYGDGVNVAARIESLADPGGVCISRGVFDQVKKKVRQGFEYMGEHTVKNISEPVRIYRILFRPEFEGKVIEAPANRKARLYKPYVIAIAAILICSGALLWFFNSRSTPIELASIERMAYPLPEKPSIAVLPFDNLSGDPNQEFFSDGLTEEIITTLSKIPKIFVIARNSTDTYKNSSAKVQKVSEELGVRYVLEGSVRKDGGRTRITAQFIDAIKGHHLWAERYDRDIKDTFAVQEEISKKILTALEVNLTEGEQAIMMAKGTSSSQAYIKVLQSTYYRRRLNAEDNSKAQRLAEEAIAFDPEYAVAYTTLSRTHVVEAWLRTSKSPRESLAKAMDLANKALSMDDSLADAYDILGNILVLKKNHDEGIRHLERAIELEPNGADFQAHMGMALYLADRSQEAVQVLLKAIRLNPNPPSWYLHNLAVAYNFVENYEEAIFWGEKAVKHDPKSLLGHYILCAIYSSAGRMEDAKREASEVLRIKPNFSVSTLEKTNPLKNESVKKRYFDSLRKAGLPEYPPNEKPVKPSIAVLRFDNMSDDPKQEYFSDGISEDIITDLSKISGLIVIARNSSFTYKRKSVNAQQIGRELQVSYLLEGSVRKAGDKVRINAQLIDASSGHHLWADRYDGRMDDVFALQDKITHKIIYALALRLSASEQKALTDKGTDNLEAYDEFLKGWQGYRLLTEAGFAEAKTHLEKAVELDPEFTRAYAALAVLYWRAIHFAAPKHRQGLGLNTRQELLAVKAKPQFLVEKAMKKPTALAHGLMSQFYLMRYQHDEALAEIERAIAMDPNDPELYAWMSEILWLMGKNSEAIESANMGLRLDPNNPATYLRQLGRSYLPDGDLEKSLQLLERANRLNPELSGTVAFHKSVIYGIQGHIEEARTAYGIFLKSRMYPVQNLSSILNYFPFADPKNLERIADALVKAGAPGDPTDYFRIFKENRINGQAVKSLLFGRKIFGVAMSTGKPIEWEWADNGEFKFTMGKFQDTGNSWIEGDVLFIQFEKIFGGLPYGWVIYRNPDGSIEGKDQYLIVTDLATMARFALAD